MSGFRLSHYTGRFWSTSILGDLILHMRDCHRTLFGGIPIPQNAGTEVTRLLNIRLLPAAAGAIMNRGG